MRAPPAIAHRPPALRRARRRAEGAGEEQVPARRERADRGGTSADAICGAASRAPTDRTSASAQRPHPRHVPVPQRRPIRDTAICARPVTVRMLGGVHTNCWQRYGVRKAAMVAAIGVKEKGEFEMKKK